MIFFTGLCHPLDKKYFANHFFDILIRRGLGCIEDGEMYVIVTLHSYNKSGVKVQT